MQGKGTVKYVRWGSAALIVAALVMLLRALPFEQLLNALQLWVRQLGFWGPAIYAAVYAVAATAFLPASALTLAAGVIFGLGVGTLTVWAGATLAVALSFVIGRYLARSKVEELAKRNPKFGAIDKAIGEEGWKIVAMMRLSPVFPFGLQNYLYGVTSIRFWPCLIASAIFMLPGTFMYTYFGYIGGQAAAAASGAGGAGNARLALQIVGLLATVAVTVYITRIASRAIKKHTHEPEASVAAPIKASPAASSGGALILAAVALLLFGSSLYAYLNRDSLRGLFGPPRLVLGETYADDPAAATFDHSEFDAVLAKYVNEHGEVDYAGLEADSAALDNYIAALGKAPFDELNRDDKLALLINAYNAFTLRLIIDNYPIDSIRSIPEADRWDAVRWNVGGKMMSLSDIEHGTIRKHFREPRIHFALVCAAVSCPKLRDEAYLGERLEEQLHDQSVYVHERERWLRFDGASGEIGLTQLYNWYGGDFEQVYGSVLGAASRYVPALEKALGEGGEIRIDWLDYDWSLNEQHSLEFQ